MTQIWRKELISALKLSLPMAGAQLAQVSLSFIDALMCGRLGASALAGAGLGTAAFAMILLPLLGIINAVSPLVAQAHGAEDPEGVRQNMRQTLILACGLGLIGILLLSWTPALLRWMEQPPELIAIAKSYLDAARWSLLPAFLVAGLRGTLDALSRPRIGLLVSLSAIGINIVCNWAFMFGHLGFPDLGVAGTGWATTLVNLWMLLLLICYLDLDPSLKTRHLLRGKWRIETAYCTEILRIGTPICFGIMAEVWLFCGLSFLMGKLGSTALAAHQIALNLSSLTFMFALGISNASTVRVGQALGKGDPVAARRAGATGMLLGMAIMSTAGLSFWLAPRLYISAFLDLNDPANAAVIGLAILLLRLATLFQIFDALQVTSQGALRGLKDTFIPMLIGFACYWLIGFGGGVVLAFQFKMGATGLWWGLILGLSSAGIGLSGRFFSHFREQNRGSIIPVQDFPR